MIGHQTRGFTLIEVMLFLAITGLMMSGVLVAVSGSINRQRYDDAVVSFQDFMQGQYHLVDNVRSNRDTTSGCDTGGIDTTGSSPQARGSSDCSIIGRYITTADGQMLTSEPIYARADIIDVRAADHASEADFITALDITRDTSTPQVLDSDVETHRVGWGTNVYSNGSAADVDFTIVMIDIGIVRTYVANSPDAPIAATISGAMATPFVICVAPDGLIPTSPRGIQLMPRSANASGVVPLTASEGESAC